VRNVDALCDCKHENGESQCALELGLDPFGPCRKHGGATRRVEVTQLSDVERRYMPYQPWPYGPVWK
jgi:hypothetical protein